MTSSDAGGRRHLTVVDEPAAQLSPPLESRSGDNNTNTTALAGASPRSRGAAGEARPVTATQPESPRGTRSEDRVDELRQRLKRIDLTQAPQPRPYVVKGLIPHRAVTMVTGEYGTCKSITMNDLSRAVVQRGMWLGEPVERCGPVVIFDAENDPEYVTIPRVQALVPALRHCEFEDIHHFHAGVIGGLDLATWEAVVAGVLDEIRPAVVIVDAVFSGGPAHKGNDNDEVTPFMRCLKRLAYDFNCAVVAIHHHKKPQPGASNDPRHATSGAQQYLNQVDRHLALQLMHQSVEDQSDGSRRVRTVLRVPGKTKNRSSVSDGDMTIAVESIETAEGELRDLEVRRVSDDEASGLTGRRQTQVIEALRANGGQMRRKDLRDATGIPDSSLDRILARGLADGWLVRPAGERGPFALVEDHGDSQEVA
jgi:hypothetical protein